MSRHLDDQPAIPDDRAPVPPARRPTWWTVRTVRAIAFACVGLAVALSLVSTLVSWRSAEAANARAVEVERRLTALEDYVQGRGEYRDREAERLEREAQERIRAGLCDLLDQLPVSPLLDQPRAKYGCGPGAAVAEPAVGPQAPPAADRTPADLPVAGKPPTARPSSPATTTAAGAAPTPVVPPPAAATPTATPAPTPTPPAAPTSAPPRLLDVEPFTDPVCRLLGVCL